LNPRDQFPNPKPESAHPKQQCDGTFDQTSAIGSSSGSTLCSLTNREQLKRSWRESGALPHTPEFSAWVPPTDGTKEIFLPEHPADGGYKRI
jgi:hypothetical protein